MASLSYYGIKCQKCPAFIATKKGDLDIKKETASNWSTEDYRLETEDVEC